MVEFNTLSKDDQKIVCELLNKTLKGEEFTKEDRENLSIDGKAYMINVLETHLTRLGFYKTEK